VLSQEEEALEKADNEQIKAAIQRRIDAFKEDLEAALPDAVKNETVAEESVEETSEETTEEVNEALKETYYACAEIDGEERRFPFENREDARKYISDIKSGVASEFEGKKIGSVWTECLNTSGETPTESLK
jgi:hypothetical protein